MFSIFRFHEKEIFIWIKMQKYAKSSEANETSSNSSKNSNQKSSSIGKEPFRIGRYVKSVVSDEKPKKSENE